jgi:hypothetical protein
MTNTALTGATYDIDGGEQVLLGPGRRMISGPNRRVAITIGSPARTSTCRQESAGCLRIQGATSTSGHRTPVLITANDPEASMQTIVKRLLLTMVYSRAADQACRHATEPASCGGGQQRPGQLSAEGTGFTCGASGDPGEHPVRHGHEWGGRVRLCGRRWTRTPRRRDRGR